MLYLVSLSVAAIAGFMACLLFYHALKEDKPHASKKHKWVLVWATLFLGAAFGGIEWTMWLIGYNLFTFFAFPLIAFFVVWFAFIIWNFEMRKDRKLWIAFLIALIVLIIIAINCMNCLANY